MTYDLWYAENRGRGKGRESVRVREVVLYIYMLLLRLSIFFIRVIGLRDLYTSLDYCHISGTRIEPIGYYDEL